MANEIVLYKPNEQFQLEVQLKDETVWLTQQQIADLFGVKRPAVTKHLGNIFREGELDMNSVCSILELTAADGKVYSTQFYNLDAILSVGYRVNSRNATIFRKWATTVLKDYMLRGYAVNQRMLHLEERIDNRLRVIENRLDEHQEQIDFFVQRNLPPVEKVFYNGQFFDARAVLEQIIKTATKRVVVIDEYIDAATFEMLDVRQKGVSADIYSSALHTTLRDAHNNTAGVKPVNTHKWSKPSHDRWLIIDEQVYHCGHSLKDMGQKLSAISLIESITAEDILKQVR
ncbi:MAG: virulence RhuM family protein [Paludibacteraceae bacterium]|nr:virulence RhuM family protein [Paludibacteraceae bacterium]